MIVLSKLNVEFMQSISVIIVDFSKLKIDLEGPRYTHRTLGSLAMIKILPIMMSSYVMFVNRCTT